MIVDKKADYVWVGIGAPKQLKLLMKSQSLRKDLPPCVLTCEDIDLARGARE